MMTEAGAGPVAGGHRDAVTVTVSVLDRDISLSKLQVDSIRVIMGFGRPGGCDLGRAGESL